MVCVVGNQCGAGAGGDGGEQPPNKRPRIEEAVEEGPVGADDNEDFEVEEMEFDVEHDNQDELAQMYAENPRYYHFLPYQNDNEDQENQQMEDEEPIELDQQAGGVAPPADRWDAEPHPWQFQMGRGFFLPGDRHHRDSGIEEDELPDIENLEIGYETDSDADTVILYSDESDDSGYDGHHGW